MIPFDPTQFKLDYPKFDQISDNKLTNTFNNGAKQLGTPVINCFVAEDEQYYWQCVVLAHILQIELTGLVGTPQNFGEGSESLSLKNNAPDWMWWWEQTPYGQQCAQIIQQTQGGGHYTTSSPPPYMANSMNAWGWYGC
jgi:hypothetical protein